MIHATLKQSTRDAHLALESKLRILVSDELSLDQYVAIQKRFYGFYRPIEGACCRSVAGTIQNSSSLPV